MAKGISAVIATIMLLMITVALIAVFYVFSSGLVSSGTGAAGTVAASTTDRMLKIVAISMAKCSNTTSTNNIINFTIQNVGTKNILPNELIVSVNDVKSDGVNVILDNSLNSGLAANSQAQVGVQTATYSKTINLKAYGPSNTEQRFLTCQ